MTEMKEVSDQTMVAVAVAVSHPDADSNNSAPRMTTLRLCLTLGSIWIAVLFSVVDDTITATLLGQIALSLNAFDKLSWLSTGYIIAISTTQLLSGHLTDIFGRRIGLLLSLGLVGVGTLICGLGRSFGVFMFGRLVQGLGGGSLGTITAFIESDIIPLERRAMIEGLGNIVCGVGLALGGVYGGFVNTAIGWRWAFYMQVPVVAVNALAIFFIVRPPYVHQLKSEHSSQKALQRIDAVGIVVITAFVVLFQLGLSTGGSGTKWDSAAVFVPLVVAAVILPGFIFWDWKYAVEPVLPLRAIAERTVASVHVTAFLSGASVYCYLFYVPIYVQVLGASTAGAGLRFLPFAAGLAMGSPVCGFAVTRLSRYYPAIFPVQATGITAAVVFYRLDETSPSWMAYVAMGLLGLYVGSGFVVNLMSVLVSIRPDQQAAVQSSVWTIRAIGTTFGLVIIGTIFQAIVNKGLTDLGPTSGTSVNASDLTTIDMLPSDIRSQVVAVYMNALNRGFLAALCLMCVSALAACCAADKRVNNLG